MIEANKFRKNLGVENDQSIRIETEMIAIIMKSFGKNNYGKTVQNYWISLSR